MQIYTKNIHTLYVVNLTHLNIGAQKNTVFGPKQRANQLINSVKLMVHRSNVHRKCV